MAIPEELKKALFERQVVPFVGAGVSLAVKRLDGGAAFPGWVELLHLAAGKIANSDLADLVKLNVRLGRFLDAAKEARNGCRFCGTNVTFRTARLISRVWHWRGWFGG